MHKIQETIFTPFISTSSLVTFHVYFFVVKIETKADPEVSVKVVIPEAVPKVWIRMAHLDVKMTRGY